MKKLNSLQMKHLNTNLLLETIISQGSISRADLSRISKLNKATVSSIIQDLLDNDLITETGDSKDTGGRKARLVEFNRNAGSVFSIDFGFDTIVAAITNLEGQIIYRKEYMNNIRELEFKIDILYNIIRDLFANNTNSHYGVIGIGIAIHGIINTDNSIEYIPYYEWNKIDLKRLIELEFEIPTFIDNDSNLFTLGEHIHTHHNKDILGINISSGVGLGIIIDKKEYRGIHGFAGEIGHMIVESDGRLCTCGNKGCLEQYASEQALVNELNRRKNKDLTINEFIQLVRLKDDDAMELFHQFVKYMAIGINNIGNLFDPEVIVLNSELINQLPKSVELIKQQLHSKVFKVKLITGSKYLRDSILMGASFMVIKNFLGLSHIILKDKE